MLFNSLDFAIFFPIVFILYWLVSKKLKLRNTVVLLASYFFYGWWDWRFLFLIIISSGVDYYVGRKIYKTEIQRKRKSFLLLSLLVNLGFLFYFKYTNFFIETFVDSFRLFGSKLEVSTLNIILPVGISFYTFQTLSYTIDIYRKQLIPTKDRLAFFTFVAFFPQLVAGPIERASRLLPQFFKSHEFNYNLVKSGFLLMAFGFFKKMVIADRAAIFVNNVYNNPTEHYSSEIVLATVFFAIQIYCDFSGYSDIAIGVGRTMGFDLMKNFDSPYFSKSITEFWRRWHISLSTWFRDYVYIPLGGSRKGKYRTYANLFIVFLVSGLWHGAAMTFVVWGAIHGFFIIVEKVFSKIRKGIFTSKHHFLNYLLALPFTLFIVCLGWVFFRANTLKEALILLKQSTYYHFETNILDLGLDQFDLSVLCIGMILLIGFEIIHKKLNAIKFLNKQYKPVRYTFYYIIVMALIVLRVINVSEFIYFQF